MNKAQLIEALADHYNGSKTEAAKALNAVVDTITQKTAAGEKVSITGFGVFEKVARSARMVRNPRTGERKRAKATAVPRFRAGSDLKAYVSGAKKLPKLGAKKTSPAAKARTGQEHREEEQPDQGRCQQIDDYENGRQGACQIHRRGEEVFSQEIRRESLNSSLRPGRQNLAIADDRVQPLAARSWRSAQRTCWQLHAVAVHRDRGLGIAGLGIVSHDQFISAQAPSPVEQLRRGGSEPEEVGVIQVHLAVYIAARVRQWPA